MHINIHSEAVIGIYSNNKENLFDSFLNTADICAAPITASVFI